MSQSKEKNRWIALYVENEVGVLAKVAGLFSAKSYNLQSLTVGTTEHEDISRMTICVSSDDITFEQIKKQLNTMVEVIKVMDLTDVPIHMREIFFAKIKDLSPEEQPKVDYIIQAFGANGGHIRRIDYGAEAVIIESALTERRNNELAALLRKTFRRIDIVRGGAVAIEAVSTSCR